MTTTSVAVADGKYVWRHESGVDLHCYRYEKPWLENRDLTGDGAILALVQEVELLREKLTIGERDRIEADRYRKLRRWMTSNVPEGWTQVERIAAIGCYVSWEAFDETLDALPECNHGLVANCPADNRSVS